MEENTITHIQDTGETGGAEEARSFTQEDIDRIVAQRLASAQREAEQQIAQARIEGRAEAERIARMSETERREHDARAAREREDALRSREAEIARRELRAEAVDMLAARGLPRELEQVLNYSDSEGCILSIDALEKAFRSAVQKGVDERINQSRGSLPRSGGDAKSAMLQRMRTAAGLDNI